VRGVSFFQYSPASDNALIFYKVRRLRSFVTLIKVELRRIWVSIFGRNILTGKTEELWGKPVPQSLCPQKISVTEPGPSPEVWHDILETDIDPNYT
jgi:hypothetical protein